jgi:hypothetical protein
MSSRKGQGRKGEGEKGYAKNRKGIGKGEGGRGEVKKRGEGMKKKWGEEREVLYKSWVRGKERWIGKEGMMTGEGKGGERGNDGRGRERWMGKE